MSRIFTQLFRQANSITPSKIHEINRRFFKTIVPVTNRYIPAKEFEQELISRIKMLNDGCHSQKRIKQMQFFYELFLGLEEKIQELPKISNSSQLDFLHYQIPENEEFKADIVFAIDKIDKQIAGRLFLTQRTLSFFGHLTILQASHPSIPPEEIAAELFVAFVEEAKKSSTTGEKIDNIKISPSCIGGYQTILADMMHREFNISERPSLKEIYSSAFDLLSRKSEGKPQNIIEPGIIQNLLKPQDKALPQH